jgi:hypothetical protein
MTYNGEASDLVIADCREYPGLIDFELNGGNYE